MLNIRLFNIDSEIYAIAVIVLIAILQLCLCFKVKNLIVRLLPTVFLFVMTLFFGIMLSFTDGWDTIAFLLFMLATGVMLAVCGICWFIWGLARLIRKNN